VLERVNELRHASWKPFDWLEIERPTLGAVYELC